MSCGGCGCLSMFLRVVSKAVAEVHEDEMHHGYQTPLPPHGFRREGGCRSVAVSHVIALGSF